MTASHRVCIAAAALLAIALNACAANQDSQDPALEGVPELSAYELVVSDDTQAEALAGEDDAIDAASDQAAQELDTMTSGLGAEVAPGLAHARAAVRNLNEQLRHFMQPIAAVVRDTDPSSEVGAVRTWGPVTRGQTAFRFVLRHGIGRRYGWLLQARPADTSDAFATVAAGRITVGFAPRRGVGSLGLDLDALARVDPTITARGQLLASFKHGVRGSVLGYALRGFTPDADAKDPIDARIQDVRLPAGTHRLRLAYRGNLPETATDAPELVLARVRHKRGEGGRADLLVSGADVPEGQVWVVSECWNAGLTSVYRIVRTCPGDGVGGERCELVRTEGEPSACARSVREPELPPADAMDPMSDDQSPDGDVTAPDSMPDGSASEADG